MKPTISTLQAEISATNARMDKMQTEMERGFSIAHLRMDNISIRIDNLDNNLNERIDRISLRLDVHIKDTTANFRELNDKIDRGFVKVPQDIAEALFPYFNHIRANARQS
jgi:hypothetical protein